MSRMGWIIALVGGGVALAIVIGVLATRNETNQPTKAEEASALCASLTALETSIKTVTSIDPSTATKGDLQSDLTAVQNDWDQVKSDAQAVQNAPTGDLDSAWDSFTSAVNSIPDSASVSDAVQSITQSADQLVSTAQATAAEINCS